MTGHAELHIGNEHDRVLTEAMEKGFGKGWVLSDESRQPTCKSTALGVQAFCMLLAAAALTS